MATTQVSKWIETLKNFQDSIIKVNAPTGEDVEYIEINMTEREIKLPSSQYSSFLTVQNDHWADTVWFSVDRFFDGVDLSQQMCVIEYVNANKEGRICPVIDIDIITDPNKLRFGWKIGREATKVAGKIRFLIHFYSIEMGGNNFTYSLSTKPCEALILESLGNQVDIDSSYDYPSEVLEEIYGRLNNVESKAVMWRDLD